MKRGTVEIKEWFFDKLENQMKNYGMLIAGTYEDGIRSNSKIRINEVLAESEKAYKINIDADTFGGNCRTYTTWIPKSVVLG